MGDKLACFKAYDIRGQVPTELDEDLAYRIGRACAEFLGEERVGDAAHEQRALRVIVGRDVRLTSASLCRAVSNGLREGGAQVLDIGLGGTEMVYFATFHEHADGGIMVTASHNPMDYNGLKLVRAGARPISGDTGLDRIEALAAMGEFVQSPARGGYASIDIRDAFVRHLLSYIEVETLRPLTAVVNAGNGGAGLVVDLLQPHLPFDFVKVHHQPDGRFPNGIPNPLLPENRTATVAAIAAHGADVGIAWDGDFDRCFFFDGGGRFIEGYYLVGLLASTVLEKHPGAKIIHDPRLTWNTIDIVRSAGGVPVQSKTGHAFIKERIRAEDAVYGGEMSAHHYFREFAYCDSGMIPWLLVLERMCKSGRSLAQMVEERMMAYPCSGEINFRVADPKTRMDRILAHYRDQAPQLDYTDGISVAFADWRFNLRMSNTEPLLRLNVESRGDRALMARRTAELRGLINAP